MDEQNAARKIWRPQSEGAIECRRCGCRDLIRESVTIVRGLEVHRCHCRYCGKRITVRKPVHK